MGDSGLGGGRESESRPEGSRDLLCPTCGHIFAPTATAPLVEPIPERRPLLWLRVLSAVAGGLLLVGASAYGAYRVGAARAAGGSPRPPSSQASLVSTDTSAPSSPATSSADASAAAPPSWLPTSTVPSSEESSGTGSGSSGSFHRIPQSLIDGLSSGGSTGSGHGSGSGGGETDLATRARMKASSTLAPAHGITYVPGNLVDGRKDTCWAEGAPGYGVGESVTLEFGSAVTVTRIEVLPGYDKFNQVDRWRSNGRVKTATVTFDDGTTQSLDFSDTRTAQSTSVPSRSTRTLTFTIRHAYPAVPGPHSAEDTSIGELHVYGR